MPLFPIQCCFLGHVLPAYDILANPEKVDKVKNWPVPKSAKELDLFFGLASYYRHFIPNFAHLAQCLYNLVSLVSTKRKNSKKTSSPSKSTISGTKPQM